MYAKNTIVIYVYIVIDQNAEVNIYLYFIVYMKFAYF